MSRLMGKRVRLGKYTIPAFLLVTLAIGTVAAVVYVIITFTTTVTVKQFPRVNFYEWATTTRANTFTESFNIFPNIKTIQDNATYGIYAEDVGKVYIRISSISNPANIDSVNVTIFNGGQQDSIVWSTGGSLPQPWSTGFNVTAAGTKYSIWIEVTGASGASIGSTSSITVEMKVESP